MCPSQHSSETQPIATSGPQSTLARPLSNINSDASISAPQFVIGDYDRGYQNFVPGAVNLMANAQSPLSAYNNATGGATSSIRPISPTAFQRDGPPHSPGRRRIGAAAHGQFPKHRLLQQRHHVVSGALCPSNHHNARYLPAKPDRRRQPHSHERRPRAYSRTRSSVSRFVQMLAGVRVDHFDLAYHDNRTGTICGASTIWCPLARQIVFKPVSQVSIYGSYSVSYLPSSGDQFSSLTTVTQQVKPEKFSNYEVGVKWDVRRDLSITTAVYRLDRTNTRATDPNDPTRILQTGSQRSNGFEVGLNGAVTTKWQIAGGYAFQDSFISNPTVSRGLERRFRRCLTTVSRSGITTRFFRGFAADSVY